MGIQKSLLLISFPPLQTPSFKPKVLVHSAAILSKPREADSCLTLPGKVRLDMHIL